MSSRLRKATESAVDSNRKLTALVDELGQELAFRSGVSGTLEEYRQELVTGRPRHALKDVLAHVESFFVMQAMQEVGGNIAQAADLLRMPEATLRYKMGKYGLR